MRATTLAWLLALAACTRPAPPPPPKPAGQLKLLPAPEFPDAAQVIADQLVQTQTAHRRLVVYVGATWCEPCRRFHEAAEKGEFNGDLGDVDVLVFDADKDGERLKNAGYTSKLIPLFAVPAADGRASGQQTEGAMDGPKMAAQMAARVQLMLQGG